MAYHRTSIAFVAAALLAMPLQELRADAAPKIVEDVDFAISCGPTSQQAFKHAVWTLHSFWYPEALEQFNAIAASEPGCAMAYWGIAMSHWYPLWYPPGPAALKAGSEAVAKALAAPTQTPRGRITSRRSPRSTATTTSSTIRLVRSRTQRPWSRCMSAIPTTARPRCSMPWR